MEPTLLQYPDFSKEFCTITDASKQACGVVLTQNHNGLQLPIAYASRAFTKGESKKCTTAGISCTSLGNTTFSTIYLWKSKQITDH